jgi:hypothetical protein
MFEHRLASLLGRSLGELDELPARELERWARYWSEEPWGPHRDNLHAALIITELLRPHLKEGASLNMDKFMLKPKADLDAAARAKFVAQLNSMADAPPARERARRR